MPVEKRDSDPSPVVPGDDAVILDLTAVEVRQLWAFHDGSIMNVDVRRHLRRSWGFCPRHTWAFAVTESARRGNVHGTVILYEDLVGCAVTALRRSAVRDTTIARRLEPRASCFTCDYAGIARRPPGPDLVATRDLVNRRESLSQWLFNCESEWSHRTCPACLGGAGLMCRPHILAGGTVPRDVPAGLADVRARLEGLSKSMRWRGPAAGTAERSSLVEALGWFAGWGIPAVLAGHVGADE